ncbi:MAG: hypothetical protein V3575_07060 [Candidatus Absconditabacteria bacterium]
MIKLLKTLLEINNYENIEQISKIGEYIGENKGNSIITNCVEGKILEQYCNLLNKKITEEEFMMIGDYTSKVNIYTKSNNIELLYEIRGMIDDPLLKQFVTKKIIITTKESLIFFESKGNDYIKLLESIQSLKSNLFII